MKRSAERFACDTSFAVSALDSSHVGHTPCRRVLIERRPALAGHAAFETYSVLTRMPVPARLDPRSASNALQTAFPVRCMLGQDAANDLFERLGELGIAGGSVYDALVGQAALSADRILLTRDARAERTYSRLGVAYELVS